jgi:hypothetical protein
MTEPADSIPPWPDLIAEMAMLRQRVSETNDIHPYTIPHLAAEDDQIIAAETRLGHPLDPMHREFLSYGNGWPEFYLGTTLLGTDDLGHGSTWAELNESLDAFYSSLDSPDVVPPRQQIYPISHDRVDASIFAIWKDGPVNNGGHPVLWLPWLDTEPYDNFFDFFRSVYQEYEEELDTKQE